MYFGLSDIGNVRENNEDYFLIKDDKTQETLKYGKCYIVCDGMGGHNAGEVASRLAAEKFIEIYYSDELKEKNLTERVKETLKIVNEKIYKLSNEKPEYKGMGTTIVGLIIKGNIGIVFNVGDSKLFRIRDNNIEQLSEDHSLVNELVKAKVITKEEAKKSNKKNILTRAIGTDKDVKPFIKEIKIKNGDRFVLCSDGLTNHVSNSEILAILKEDGVKGGTKKLVSLAKKRGGTDNITVISIFTSKQFSHNLSRVVLYLFSLLILLFFFMSLYNLYKPKISIDTSPEGAFIYSEKGRFIKKTPCTMRVKINELLTLKRHGFLEKKIKVIRKNGRALLIDEKGEEIDGPVILNKIIKLKVIPEDAYIYIDNEPLNPIERMSNLICLPLGKHKIKIEKENYKTLTKNIEVKEDTDELKFNLEEILFFTLETEPEGAQVFVWNSEEKRWIPIKTSEDNITPLKIDFSKYSGKKIRLIKEDREYIFFKEYLAPIDISDIPSKVILSKYKKITINTDIEPEDVKINNFTLIEYKDKTYLVPYDLNCFYGLCKLEIRTNVNNFEYIISKQISSFKNVDLEIRRVEFKIIKETEKYVLWIKIKNGKLEGNVFINGKKYKISLGDNSKYDVKFPLDKNTESIKFNGKDEKGISYTIIKAKEETQE